MRGEESRIYTPAFHLCGCCRGSNHSFPLELNVTMTSPRHRISRRNGKRHTRSACGPEDQERVRESSDCCCTRSLPDDEEQAQRSVQWRGPNPSIVLMERACVVQLLLFTRRCPDDHIWNSVAGFDGMELIYHDPHGAIVGSRQRKKQQRLWREKDQRRNMCARSDGNSPHSSAPLGKESGAVPL